MKLIECYATLTKQGWVFHKQKWGIDDIEAVADESMVDTGKAYQVEPLEELETA